MRGVRGEPSDYRLFSTLCHQKQDPSLKELSAGCLHVLVASSLLAAITLLELKCCCVKEAPSLLPLVIGTLQLLSCVRLSLSS